MCQSCKDPEGAVGVFVPEAEETNTQGSSIEVAKPYRVLKGPLGLGPKSAMQWYHRVPIQLDRGVGGTLPLPLRPLIVQA